VLTRACATRDIHVPVAHGVHPARRPSGVPLLTRVRGFAALGELRDFKLKQKPPTVGAASYWSVFGHKPQPLE